MQQYATTCLTRQKYFLFYMVAQHKFDYISNINFSNEYSSLFQMEGFPISSTALDQVMGYLDINKDGEIDLL